MGFSNPNLTTVFKKTVSVKWQWHFGNLIKHISNGLTEGTVGKDYTEISERINNCSFKKQLGKAYHSQLFLKKKQLLNHVQESTTVLYKKPLVKG